MHAIFINSTSSHFAVDKIYRCGSGKREILLLKNPVYFGARVPSTTNNFAQEQEI